MTGNVPCKLIVIEGLDATGKSTLVPMVAKSLNATPLSCPPRLEAPGFVGGDLRPHFDRCPPEQRRAYYRASNLIASEQARAALTQEYVVMDRYWTSTVAFAALDADSSVDEAWHGRYPSELRTPDILILLTVGEENRLKRLRGRGEPTTSEEQNLAADQARRAAVHQVYRAFNPIEIDTSNRPPDAVCEVVLAALRHAGVC